MWCWFWIQQNHILFNDQFLICLSFLFLPPTIISLSNHPSLPFIRYFVIDFDGPPTIVEPLREYFRRDIDIIRPSLLNRVSEQWPEDTVCEGPHDERYNPVVKSAKKLKVNVFTRTGGCERETMMAS